jgi:hypothetical protein
MTVHDRTVEGRSYRQEIRHRRSFVYDLEKGRFRMHDLEWVSNPQFKSFVGGRTVLDTSGVRQSAGQLVTFDGRQGQRMPMTNPGTVIIESRDRIIFHAYNMIGIWGSAYGRGDRLWSLFVKEKGAEVEGVREIEGSPYYVLKVQEGAGQRGPAYLRLWVGPDIGFHIRRIQHVHSDTIYGQVDTKWQKIAGNLWTPIRSTYRYPQMESTVQYEKLRVNIPLVDSLFVINAPTARIVRMETPKVSLDQIYGKEPPAWNVTGARGVGKDVKLSDFKGKWVLLEFWGYW